MTGLSKAAMTRYPSNATYVASVAVSPHPEGMKGSVPGSGRTGYYGFQPFLRFFDGNTMESGFEEWSRSMILRDRKTSAIIKATAGTITSMPTIKTGVTL